VGRVSTPPLNIHIHVERDSRVGRYIERRIKIYGERDYFLTFLDITNFSTVHHSCMYNVTKSFKRKCDKEIIKCVENEHTDKVF
jgi:hypothetical protein